MRSIRVCWVAAFITAKFNVFSFNWLGHHLQRNPRKNCSNGIISLATCSEKSRPRPCLSTSCLHVESCRRDPRLLVTDHGPRSKAKDKKSSFVHCKQRLPNLNQQLAYARNGHTVLRNVLDSEFILTKLRPLLLGHARKNEFQAWKQKVEVAVGKKTADSCETVLDCRRELQRHFHCNEVDLPFLQYFNNWRLISEVEALVKDENLGQTAAELMNVKSVRLYQDSLFWKRAGDRPTPWHVDARMAPFDTSHMITFWIPLQDIATHEDSGLVFCSASHRDFALPYWNPIPSEHENEGENSEWQNLEQRYGSDAIVDHLPLQVGDVTVHSGWTLHCADAKSKGKIKDRLALAVTYVDGRAPVRKEAIEAATLNTGRGDNEDAWSFQDWVGEVQPMKRCFFHKLVPIVWPVSMATTSIQRKKRNRKRKEH